LGGSVGSRCSRRGTQPGQTVRGIVGGRLDVLVANAGVAKSADIEDTTVEDFDRLFAVDVRSPFFLVQQTLPILGNGSSIVVNRKSFTENQKEMQCLN
jgi:NAD(P)-dependent dehydrogenase (short-subunit alcohol dehydrogenase family)